MKVLWAFTLLVLVLPQTGLASSDVEQSQKYIHCLLDQKVNPDEVPKDIDHACLSAAGISDPGETARKQAISNLRNCFTLQAVTYDDGISPVSEIAGAILPICGNEWEQFVSSLWLYPEAKKLMREEMNKYGMQFAVMSVLTLRKIMRNLK